MTSKQYEHLGRAVECCAILNSMSGRMDDYRENLAKELNAIRPDIEAKKWVTDRYGNVMAEWRIPCEFFEAVVGISIHEEKERLEKGKRG